MTTDEIRDLLVTILTGAARGKKEARWTQLIGPIESINIVQHTRSNWRISPIATGPELAAIISASEIVRAEHPYADWAATSRPVA